MDVPTAPCDAKLDEFLCFAVYSTNLAFSRTYRPMLEALGLTYLQYIVLVALWERDRQRVGELCDRLFLATNTLTPVVKKLERAGFVQRCRSESDDRQVSVVLTPKGWETQRHASEVPGCILGASGLTQDKLDEMVRMLCQLRGTLFESAQHDAPLPVAGVAPVVAPA